MDSETNNDNYYEYEYLDECLEISTGSSLTEMISMSQQQPSSFANIRSRKSYTLETKLKIFDEFDPHNKFYSSCVFKKILNSTNKSKLWLKQREQLKAKQQTAASKMRNMRHLSGSGRPKFHPEIEDELMIWIDSCLSNAW
ncbi:hypothetical protein PVAND_004479 [Polypedilum vanderplanki]|uniref:Uncharacterized protein n=1 Tax=Polypedilum vanderplanki TaxID=319348 RepID=A0A9J6BY95_POLVA|nr:hypothetical protein PVAND_004479 [Polypedilum vanderplanki]